MAQSEEAGAPAVRLEDVASPDADTTNPSTPSGTATAGPPPKLKRETKPKPQPRVSRLALSPVRHFDDAIEHLNAIVGGRASSEFLTACRFGWLLEDRARTIRVVQPDPFAPDDEEAAFVAHLPWDRLAEPEPPLVRVRGDALPYYAALPADGCGTLWVDSVTEVLALAAAGIVAVCLPPCGPETITPKVADWLTGWGYGRVVFLPQAGARGYQRAWRRALELRALGVAAELRRWPAGSIPGYTAIDECAAHRWSYRAIWDAVGALPAEDLPELPPLGLYTPPGMDVALPHGFVMSRDGVYRMKPGFRGVEPPTFEQITAIPVWLGAEEIDVGGHDAALEVVAEQHGKRVVRSVLQSEVLFYNGIHRLGDKGLRGFNSSTASAVVDYFSGMLACNTLPVVRAVTAQGWVQEEDEARPAAFVHGETMLRSGAAPTRAKISERCRMDPADLAKIRTRGSAERWAQIPIRLAEDHHHVPLTMLVIGAASTLNALLEAPPILGQLAGDTSQGKTSVLSYVQSLSAHPRSYQTLNSTNVAIERILATHGDLPVCLDELQAAGRNPREMGEMATKLLYEHHSAQGRGRGERETQGNRRRARWNANIVCTGEMEITSFSPTAGAELRGLVYWGPPFGEPSEATGKLIDELDAIAAAHHGHAIPRLAQRLLDKSDAEVDTLREHAVRYAARYVKEAPAGTSHNLVRRMARNYGVLHVAARELEAAFDGIIPAGTFTGALKATWSRIAERLRSVDPAERALDLFAQYAQVNAHRIESGYEGVNACFPQEPGGLLGKRFVRHKETWVGLSTKELRAHFKDHGQDLKTATRHWADRGWLLRAGEGGAVGDYDVPLSIAGFPAKIRLTCLNESVLAGVGGDVSDVEPVPKSETPPQAKGYRAARVRVA